MKIDPVKMWWLTFVLTALTGCSGGESAPPAASPPAVVNAPPPPPPAPPPPAAATSAPPAATTTPEPERQKAEVGVGAKGHYEPGILTTPLSVYFRAEELITFNAKIPKAMQLFKATEERLPKSHEEFMERIIKENDIVLPQLPGGRRYLYDPKTGELMVEQPRR